MISAGINRLIILGNGFDLNLGLKTSYKDFIYGFINHIIENQKQMRRDKNNLFKIKGVLREGLQNEPLGFLIDNFIQFTSPLLRQAIEDIENKNWTDLEKIYYSLLKDIYSSSKNLEEVKRLNDELVEIKKFLTIYLMGEVGINHAKIKDEIECYFENFARPFEERDFDEATLRNCNNIKNKIPSEIMILNFNYTTLFKNSYKTIKNSGIEQSIKTLNIHGSINNPSSMVFGYGDEHDEVYDKLELLDEDEWLRNFKSFSYFKSKDYDKLLGFIESGPFQTWILGHSCGLSDKTLLNYIFQHKHCINLKAYYYEWKMGDEKCDNFDEICYSISRIMKDKVKMRQIVTKKHDGCRFTEI